MTAFKPTEAQAEAINAIDVNVAVSAGAGSGKTRVLVERYLNILYQSILKQQQKLRAGGDAGAGIGVKNILAVTFTRKAAAEMRERIRLAIMQLLEFSEQMELAAKAGATLSAVNYEMPWERKVREEAEEGMPEYLRSINFWEKYLHDMDKAQIATIDSLCSGILKEHPLEACIDPHFTVAEGLEEEEFIRGVIKVFLRSRLENNNAAAKKMAEIYGISALKTYLRQLSGAAEDIVAYCAQKDFAANYLRVDTGEAVRDLYDYVEQLAALENCGSNQSGINSLRENLGAVKAGLLGERIDWQPYKKYVKKIKNMGNAVKGILKNINCLEEKILQADTDGEAIKLLSAWQEFLTDFASYLKEERRRREFFGFADVEQMALQLLSDNSKVRHKLQLRYAYIMVDEFQDTNDLQRKLVYLLCGDDEDVLHNKKLFIVGDPKQSIYKFRGADVSVFARVCRDVAASENGMLISLRDNYRSTRAVLASCRDAFTPLMGTDRSKDVFFEDLYANGKDGVKPRLLQVAYTEEQKSYSLDFEAACVASEIYSLHEQGTQYGDMAVLLAKMTNCENFASALRQWNIPYNVIDGRGFYERQEITDLLNLFKALDNKHCNMELAGVLRSPYFGLDDETITALFFFAEKYQSTLMDTVREKHDTVQVKEQQRPLLARAAAILAELYSCAALYSLPELWLKMMRVLRVEVVMFRQSDGRSKFANVKKLHRDMLKLCSEKKLTLSGWLDYIHRQKEAGEQVNAANDDSSDAVQIMTIHKSKGLEFNTVIIPQTASGVRGNYASVFFTKENGLGISALVSGELKKSSVLLRQLERDKELEEAERLRLLYVAMTRAEENLIIIGSKNISSKRESQAKNWLVTLSAIFGDNASGMEVKLWRYEDIKKVNDAGDYGAGFVAKFSEEMALPLEQYHGSGRIYYSATSLQEYLYCQRRYYYSFVENLPPVEVRGDGNGIDRLTTGLILHKALEFYEGDAEAAFAKATAAVDDNKHDRAAYEELRRLLKNYIDSGLLPTAEERCLREWKFTLPLADDIIFLGVADCICIKSDGTVKIIDYKTGRPFKDEDTALGYRYQLTLYKLAVERILRLTVDSSELHFLRDLSVWKLPDTSDYVPQILSLVEEMEAKTEEKAFACNTEHCLHCPYEYLCDKQV